MAYSLHIIRASKETLIADNSRFLEVEVELRDGDTVVENRKFAYELGTSKEEVQADLEKFLLNYQNEQESAVLDKELRAKEEETDEVITSLTGVEITHDHARKKSNKGKTRKAR